MRRKILKHVIQTAKDLRKNQTNAEKLLWGKIRNKRLEGFRFLRQYSIGRYIADFYCSKANVVIEVDGGIHNQVENKEYDLIREEIIKANGIRIIRFHNDEIINNIDTVLKRLICFIETSSYNK